MPAFPAKTNYAAGDILTAAQMVDVGNAINALNGTSAGKNVIINGACEFAQRGTSVNLGFGATYGLDRFYVNSNSSITGTMSRQTFTPGTVVGASEFEYYLRTNVTGVSGGSFLDVFCQKVEGVQTFAGQTVTVSFWAKAASAGSYGVYLAQEFGTGGSAAIFYNNIVSITTSWQRITSTFTLGGLTGKTIGANNTLTMFVRAPSVATLTFEATGIQMELGSVATTFSRAGGSIQGELAACQRYYYLAASGTPLAIGSAFANSASLMRAIVNFPVTMRRNPDLVASSGTNYYIFRAAASDDGFNSLTIGDNGTTCVSLYNNTEIASTAGQGGYILTNNAAASVAFSAEL